MSEFQEFGKNVWIVEGPQVRDFGVMFTTRMTIVRLRDGSLWVDSPVPVSTETQERVTALGPVTYLVAGTPRHVWRLEEWHKRFPEAQVWAARKTPLTLKNEDLEMTGVLTDAVPEGWAGEIEQVAFKGSSLIEEIVFFHKESRTLILDDLIQRVPLKKGKPFRNALLKMSGVAYPNGSAPLDMRLSFTRRAEARKSLERVLSWDFDKLIIAHGCCVEENARAFVEHAFRWLTKAQT